MGKTAGPLAPIKTVDPNCPINPYTLHYAVTVFFKKKKKSHLHTHSPLKAIHSLLSQQIFIYSVIY